MAAPAAAAAVAAIVQFEFTHTGAPDYSVVGDVIALGGDPWVHLKGQNHPLAKVTSFAPWSDSPAVPPATESPGKCIRQSVIDQWCSTGGIGTPAFKAHPNELLRSARPSRVGDFFLAHVAVGDLDLSSSYTERQWEKALVASAQACRGDSRIQLEDSFYYDCQPRPASGAGSGAAENWMYQWDGELVIGKDLTAKAAGLLMRGAAPRGIVAVRDASGTAFRRFMIALSKVAKARSDFFESAMAGSSTPEDEIREYVVDTWAKLVKTGYCFKFGGRVAQHNMELEAASQMAFGSKAQQELACKNLLLEEVDESPLLCSCIGEEDELSQAERLESFELLADIFFPGSRLL